MFGPKPRLLIIHGLNNNAAFFQPIRNHFENLGWETHFIVLPCHGENRFEARDFKEAFACFDRNMKEKATSPYHVLAFSQGALFLQLWLESGKGLMPMSQVLLAPALYIHRLKMLSQMIKFLPGFAFIKSFSPKGFSRWKTLMIWEYRILMDAIHTWQKRAHAFKVPTLLIVDPEDELVDAMALKKYHEESFQDWFEFEFWERPYLNRKYGLGRHHILMHPRYFSEPDWDRFTSRVNYFFIGKAELKGEIQ